jgi:hypothetical protein
MAGDDKHHVSEKIESSLPTKISYFRLVSDQGVVTQQIMDHPYPGSGTEDDPYAVTWIPEDPRNPMNFSEFRKWFLTAVVAIATLAVALVSSAYTGGVAEIEAEFGIGSEVATLGVSLFVLGFAVSYSPPDPHNKLANELVARLHLENCLLTTTSRSVLCSGLPSPNFSVVKSFSLPHMLP